MSTPTSGSTFLTCYRWNLGDVRVSLMQKEVKGNLKLSYSSTPATAIHFLDENLYVAASYTVTIATLFRDIVALNLRKQINSAAFAFVFTGVPYVRREREYVHLEGFRVALFGQVNRETQEIQEARWGVLDENKRTARAIEIPRPEGLVRECLINVLGRGQTIKLYERQFRAIATCDAEGRIQSLALEALQPFRCSLYDATVRIDQDNWAITLLSEGQGSVCRRTCFGREFGGESGHAMIACEGVENGFPFFKYAHLTNHEAPPGQGRVRLESRWIERTLNGPTWRRTRAAVERMLRPIQQASDRQELQPFILGWQVPALTSLAAGTVAVGASAVTVYCASRLFRSPGTITLANIDVLSTNVSRCQLLVGTTEYLRSPAARKLVEAIAAYRTNLARIFYYVRSAAVTGTLAYIFDSPGKSYDCTRWALTQLPVAGVQIQLPFNCFTPKQIIQYLREHPEHVKLEE